MKALITGGSGFIGKALCTKLVAEGNEVVVFDRRKGDLEKVTYIEGDLNDLSYLEEKFDVIFHLAALSSQHKCEKDPKACVKVNVDGMINVLEFAKKCSATIVFPSTIQVYNGRNKDKFREEDVLSNSLYGITKYIGEKLIEQYCEEGMNGVVLRFSYVYGPGLNRGVVYDIQNGGPLFMHEDTVLDFIHINDVVGALLHGVNAKGFGVYNMGSGYGVSVKELMELMGKQLEGAKVEPVHLVLDVSKATKFGYVPKMTLKEGLKRL